MITVLPATCTLTDLYLQKSCVEEKVNSMLLFFLSRYTDRGLSRCPALPQLQPLVCSYLNGNFHLQEPKTKYLHPFRKQEGIPTNMQEISALVCSVVQPEVLLSSSITESGICWTMPFSCPAHAFVFPSCGNEDKKNWVLRIRVHSYSQHRESAPGTPSGAQKHKSHWFTAARNLTVLPFQFSVLKEEILKQ